MSWRPRRSGRRGLTRPRRGRPDPRPPEVGAGYQDAKRRGHAPRRWGFASSPVIALFDRDARLRRGA